MPTLIHEEKETLVDQINPQTKEIFLERIPEKAYQEMLDVFANEYHFQNGERMRIANYYVGISRALADTFIQFIKEVMQNTANNSYPKITIPDGFGVQEENLLPTEQAGGFSFGSFDMAVSEDGLQNIEFQAVATYPLSAAKLNQILLKHLPFSNVYSFADDPATNWDDLIALYDSIISDGETEGIVLTDRLLNQQKTNFEFYATQKELNTQIELVDLEAITENEGTLFYEKDQHQIKINRLYNRVLLSEALFEDNYPYNTEKWKFRFDKEYQSLKFINHPVKLYEVSKRLSPYIHHPFNPECFELAEVVEEFKSGALKLEDYIWKHKWGAAGHRLLLSPTLQDLDTISDELDDYIAQRKVSFKVFKTDDDQEKIIELRFMTAHQDDKMIIVPMARIGHLEEVSGVKKFKIHFGDNNKEGYGFSPVVIFDRHVK